MIMTTGKEDGDGGNYFLTLKSSFDDLLNQNSMLFLDQQNS